MLALLKCLLALKFLCACWRVLLPHFYTTGSSLGLLSEGKTGSLLFLCMTPDPELPWNILPLEKLALPLVVTWD